MKRLIMHSMFAAAALVAVAGSASAQIMKAEIPFAFRAGSRLMQPGSYEMVRIRTGNSVMFTLRNRDNDTAVLLANYGQSDADKTMMKADMPKLGFACTDRHCALQEVWTGGDSAYRFFVPKHDRDEVREIALSRSSSKGD